MATVEQACSSIRYGKETNKITVLNVLTCPLNKVHKVKAKPFSFFTSEITYRIATKNFY